MLQTQQRFLDVIFMDESTIEMSTSGQLCFYKPGSDLERLPSKAAKPKHSYKVRIWGGISYKGTTSCCIFTGVMDSVIYQKILADNLLPFVSEKFPEGYRIYQDKDSKHNSMSTKEWMQSLNMLDKVWKTPASSPDPNP